MAIANPGPAVYNELVPRIFSPPVLRGVDPLDDTKTRILSATIKAVRRYSLEGVRIQNISQLAGISPGAIYRHFKSKDELLAAAFLLRGPAGGGDFRAPGL